VTPAATPHHALATERAPGIRVSPMSPIAHRIAAASNAAKFITRRVLRLRAGLFGTATRLQPVLA